MFTFVWRTSFTSGPSLTTTAFKLPMRNWTTRPYSWNKRLIHNYCTTGYYQRWVVHLLQSCKSLKWNFLEPSKEVQTADQRPRSKTQFNIWIWLFKDFFRQGKSRLGLVIVAQLIEVCCNYHLVIKDQRGRQFIYSNVLPWTRRVLAHLGAWVVDILAPEQHYEEAQPCQPDHKQAWGEYQLVLSALWQSDGGGDKGNRHNDEENGQNVHSSILRFFEIL